MLDFHTSFPGQQANEPVFIFARPYPLAFLPTAALFTLIYLLSLLAQLGLLTGFFTGFTTDAYNIGILFISVFQLVALTVFFVAVFDFYFDIIIVTDRRLVDIDQEQLFFRRISELSLEDIEDVSSQVKGVFPTIFNYGRIEIQTAGERSNFVIENIHYPREVTALILDLKQQAEANIEVRERFPQTHAVGMINNKLITTAEELQRLEAISPTDTVRLRANANR